MWPAARFLDVMELDTSLENFKPIEGTSFSFSFDITVPSDHLTEKFFCAVLLVVQLQIGGDQTHQWVHLMDRSVTVLWMDWIQGAVSMDPGKLHTSIIDLFQSSPFFAHASSLLLYT